MINFIWLVSAALLAAFVLRKYLEQRKKAITSMVIAIGSWLPFKVVYGVIATTPGGASTNPLIPASLIGGIVFLMILGIMRYRLRSRIAVRQ